MQSFKAGLLNLGFPRLWMEFPSPQVTLELYTEFCQDI